MKAAFRLLVLLLLSFSAQAQDGGRSLVLRCVYDQGIVLLRWGTSSPVVWDLIRSNGIVLTSQEASAATAAVLGGAPLRVWTDEQWKSRSKDLPGAARVAGLLQEMRKRHAQLTDLAQADLERSALTGLLLSAEFSFPIAEGLALGYRDGRVESGKVYCYTISVSDTVHHDTLRAVCFVNTDAPTPLYPVTGVKAIGEDGVIELFWNRIPEHSGYYVERRATPAGEWKRLNEMPRIYASDVPAGSLFSDSVANGRNFEYRVLALDAFGRHTGPSETVTIQAGDRRPPEPPFNVSWKKKLKGGELTWSNPPPESDLAGYAVLRSQDPDDGYVPVHKELLAPKTTRFYEELPSSGTYYYRLIASDRAGNLSIMSVRAMAVVDDTIPASVPQGLTAMADTSGVITLRWRRCSDGDLAGYRPYRMVRSGKTPEFLPLTPGVITDTTFTDTVMNSLRDRFVYRVRSVDRSGNYSAPSIPAGIQLPDLAPPVQPVIIEHMVVNHSVQLRFTSPSLDVEHYEVLRRTPPADTLDFRKRSTAREWSDSTVQRGTGYRYEVVAVDTAGNASLPSKSVLVKPAWPVETDLRTPAAPMLVYDKTKKCVAVKWNYPNVSDYSAIVFRRKDQGPFMQLSPLLTASQYEDAAISTGAYDYALRFYLKAAGGSEMSPSATITVP